MSQDHEHETPPIILRVAADQADTIMQPMRRVAQQAEAASLEGFVTGWEAWAQETLALTGLPLGEAFVRIQPDGHWALDLPSEGLTSVQDLLRPGEEIGNIGVLIDRLFGRESKEHYAYEILWHISVWRRIHTTQDMDGSLNALHRLHTLTTSVRIRLEWEPDARRGRKVRAGGRHGWERLMEEQGSLWQSNYEDWQRRAEFLSRTNPDLQKRQIYERVGQQVERSARTIRRHIKLPKKHKPRH